MFRFANTEYLWLLAILPVMLVLFWLLRVRRCRLMSRFGDEALVKELMPDANVMITRAGCTVSSHCGRNTLGVLFIRKNPIEA